MKQLLSTGDVLEMLGLEKGQHHKVRYMVETGTLRPVKAKGFRRWRFRRAEVIALIRG